MKKKTKGKKRLFNFETVTPEQQMKERNSAYDFFTIKAPPLQSPVVLHNFGTNEKGELIKIY